MKLSIIILNYHTVGLVKQCVRGLISAQISLSHEIIVVDNASYDGCGEMLKNNFPHVKFVQTNFNYGYAAGNNVGLRLAQGEYKLILNPDIVVLPGNLEKLVAFMDARLNVGLAGPKLINPDGTLQYSTYNFPVFWLPPFLRTPLGRLPGVKKRLNQYHMTDWNHQENREVDWLLGACFIARSSAIERVGLFDERFFLYLEDTDWCMRFWKNGFKVYYVAEVEFIHYHERLSAQASFGGLFSRITWIHIASWLKYFMKWGIGLPLKQ